MRFCPKLVRKDRMIKKYSEKKIVQILNEVTAGAKVPDTCRKYGISNATYDNWKNKYSRMSVSDVKRLKEKGKEACVPRKKSDCGEKADGVETCSIVS